MTTGLIITAASLSALGWLVYMFVTAPEGYEDSEGWHAGEPHSDYNEED